MNAYKAKFAEKISLLFFISSTLFSVNPLIVYAEGPKEKIKNAAEKVEEKTNKGKEKIKEKFHEAADSFTKEEVHNKIDQVADKFDKEKINETVDKIADYFDKDKIKDAIDMIADYLDRDKIKQIIEIVSDQLDRDKIKDLVDQAFDSIDKEKIKEGFDIATDKVASSISKGAGKVKNEVEKIGNDNATDKVARSFNKGVGKVKSDIEKIGNDKQSLQKYIVDYDWDNVISETAIYGPATLSHLKLNGNEKVVLARPGERIKGEVVCSLNRDECSPLSMYRVVLGIKNREGQTTVFNHFGLRAGKETDQFVLTAPKEKGVYQLGFRVVQAALESTALNAWNAEENSSKVPTIGLIIVN